MAFDFNAWQRAAWEHLRGWNTRLIPGIVNAGYVGVAAGVLWPLVYEAQTGDTTRVIMALMKLTEGLGTSLLSEQILRWKDEANGEPDVAVWIRDHLETDAALRLELERVVEKLQALELAKSVLPESDREWFERTLRHELVALGSLPRLEAKVTGSYNVVALGEGAQASLTLQEIHYHNAPDTEKRITLLRQAYLNRLFEQCNVLDLDGIDLQTAETRVSLHAVYTALSTGHSGHGSSALSQLDQHKYLVLLGDPGSGKSTFVSYVAMCLCGEELGRSEANLQTLNGTPFAEPNGDDPNRRERSVYEPRWKHGALLPVRVILRDFAARGLPDVMAHASTDHLWKFIVGELGETLADLAEPLKQELLDR